MRLAYWNLCDWKSQSNAPWVGISSSQVCSWWHQIIFTTSGYLYKHFTENLAMHICFYYLRCLGSPSQSSSPKMQWYLHPYTRQWYWNDYVESTYIHYMVCNLPWHPLHSQNLLCFGHQNKGVCILSMKMFQWANHGVLQFMSHLFFKQIEAQTILDQIDYNRWAHIFLPIFTCQYPRRCFIIATN